MAISEEESKRRSELARQMHQEVADPVTGRRRFGGPQPGAGRPRKKRASEIVADRIAHDADEIYKAMKDGLKAKQPTVRLQAARDMLQVENKETELKLKEERALEEIPTDELVDIVAERFATLAEAGIVGDIQLGDYVDGTAVEHRAELEGAGSEDDLDDDETGTGPVREARRDVGASPFARRAQD